jgi:hypothetical protein
VTLKKRSTPAAAAAAAEYEAPSTCNYLKSSMAEACED